LPVFELILELLVCVSAGLLQQVQQPRLPTLLYSSLMAVFCFGRLFVDDAVCAANPAAVAAAAFWASGISPCSALLYVSSIWWVSVW